MGWTDGEWKDLMGGNARGDGTKKHNRDADV